MIGFIPNFNDALIKLNNSWVKLGQKIQKQTGRLVLTVPSLVVSEKLIIELHVPINQECISAIHSENIIPSQISNHKIY